MKKYKTLKSLAALGLIAGAMGTVEGAEAPATTACVAPAADKVDALFKQIDAAHQAMFKTADCETQNLMLQLANQSCKAKNSCAGLNSCKSEKNSCAGLGACAGTSPGPFKDKNQALDVASKHMAKKRAEAAQGK
jgi:hypothetical protein